MPRSRGNSARSEPDAAQAEAAPPSPPAQNPAAAIERLTSQLRQREAEAQDLQRQLASLRRETDDAVAASRAREADAVAELQQKGLQAAAERHRDAERAARALAEAASQRDKFEEDAHAARTEAARLAHECDAQRTELAAALAEARRLRTAADFGEVDARQISELADRHAAAAAEAAALRAEVEELRGAGAAAAAAQAALVARFNAERADATAAREAAEALAVRAEKAEAEAAALRERAARAAERERASAATLASPLTVGRDDSQYPEDDAHCSLQRMSLDGTRGPSDNTIAVAVPLSSNGNGNANSGGYTSTKGAGVRTRGESITLQQRSVVGPSAGGTGAATPPHHDIEMVDLRGAAGRRHSLEGPRCVTPRQQQYAQTSQPYRSMDDNGSNTTTKKSGCPCVAS